MEHEYTYHHRILPFLPFLTDDHEDTEKDLCPDCGESFIHWFMNPENKGGPE